MKIKLKSSVVKKLRENKLWSQEELADASDLSLRTIQRAESGESTSAETVKALASVFEIDTDELMLNDNSDYPNSTPPLSSSLSPSVPTKKVIKIVILFVCTILIIGFLLVASESGKQVPIPIDNEHDNFESISEGSSSAKDWLAIVDAENYAESWQQTDVFFKTQISKEEWANALQQARKPLGIMLSRSILNNTKHTSLPGMADGEYLVIQFQSSFQNKQYVIETLTLSKSSGLWRPVGYFIK